MQISELAGLPQRARDEIAAFVIEDHWARLRAGTASVAQALDMVGEAFEEARARFEKDHHPGLKEMCEEAAKGAEAVRGKYEEFRNTGALFWGEAGPVFQDPPPKLGVEPAPQRWMHTPRMSAVAHLCVHSFDQRVGHVDVPTLVGIPAELQRTMEALGPELHILSHAYKPTDIARMLEIYKARRIAEKLTAPDTKDRIRYRLQRIREGGPGFPHTLVTAVAVRMKRPENTVRDLLKASGFQLPQDLKLKLKKLHGRRGK